MKTDRISTGIALLILQHLHGHPKTGYENPKNEYRYSSTHSPTFKWSPYNRIWKSTEWVQVQLYSFFNVVTGYENPQNEYRYSSTHSLTLTWSPYNRLWNPQNEYRYCSTHSSTFTCSPYNRLWKPTEWVQVQLYSFFNVDMVTL